MRIREYSPNDLDALRRLHAAQGFGYPFPDLESPLFVTKLILEDEETEDEAAESSAAFSLRVLAGSREAADSDSLPASAASSPEKKPRRIAMAILLRLTAEAYLLHDPAAGTPHQRWQRFLALHEAARNSAAAKGLDDVQAFLPP